MSSLTQESILSFLLEHGGKAKNSELLSHFRSRINNSDDPAEKQHNRDLFKKLVNSVAVVQQIDETKFVVVKKRYHDFIKDAPQCAASQMDHDSQNTSFSVTSPRRAQPVKALSDIENNNSTRTLNLNGNYCDENRSLHEGSVQTESVDTTEVGLRVLNISGHQANRAGKSGSVFAVVAVKSPPRTSAPATSHDELQVSHQTTTTQGSVSTQSAQTVHFQALKNDVLTGWDKRQAEDVKPPVRPPSHKTSKQGEDAKYSESVPLDPVAHEWLVKCAAGLWGQVYALLLQDIHLAQRKDFMSGFTVLHWAAKEGNCEIINQIMDISRKGGTYMNINSKAHGGYTPLHIAALHGHTTLMVLLVQDYGANINERDNDGKKAFHYLGRSVSTEVRALLGALQHSKHRERKDEEEHRKHRSMNSISKRFHPHIGKKQRTTKYAQDWGE